MKTPPEADRLRGILSRCGLEKHPGAEHVSLSAVKYLSRLDDGGVRTALDIFTDLRPGTNFQKEILALAEEVSARENVPAADVLNEAVQDLPNGPRARKLEAVRNKLHERRNPELTKYEEEFRNIASEIGAGPDVKWEHTPFFEEPGVTFSVNFRDPKQLEKILITLSDAMTKGLMGKLVSLCSGRSRFTG